MRKLVTLAFLAAIAAPLALDAQEAEVTANAGWLSQYYYRGLPIKTSSANAGLDFTAGGLYLGTWAADVGDGSEVDIYAGFSVDVNEQVSVTVGGTGYFYTGEYDQEYFEINLGLGLGPISIDYAGGSYRLDPEPASYSFFAVTAEHMGWFATLGTSAYSDPGDPDSGFSDTLGDALDPDLGLQYLEAGYGFSAADLDFTISALWNDADLAGEFDGDGDPTDEFTLILGVSKTFTIDVN